MPIDQRQLDQALLAQLFQCVLEGAAAHLPVLEELAGIVDHRSLEVGKGRQRSAVTYGVHHAVLHAGERGRPRRGRSRCAGSRTPGQPAAWTVRVLPGKETTHCEGTD